MMPSPESAKLTEQSRSISARMAAGAGADLASMRSVPEELHVRTAEPTDVTYEQTTWAGRPAMWARPPRRRAPDSAPRPAWRRVRLEAYEQLLSTGAAALDIVIAGDSAGAEIADWPSPRLG